MRRLGLDPDAQSRAFSNFLLPLGADIETRAQEGRELKGAAEQQSW